MRADVIPMMPAAAALAEEKAALLREALDAARAAQAIEESDEAFDQAGWMEWYGRVLADCRDIKLVVGAVEVRLAQQRGARIRAEGERRGGDVGNQYTGGNLPPGGRLPSPEYNRRSRDRAIASQPAAVDTYVQVEVKAGRVPSVKGAHRAAHKASRPRSSTTPKARNPAVRSGRHSRVLEKYEAFVAAGAGSPHSHAEWSRLTGYAENSVTKVLEHLPLVPWFLIEAGPDGVEVRVDTHLREYCERHAKRPSLGGQSLQEFYTNLRAMITAKRKANHDEVVRRWTPEGVSKVRQRELLNEIEAALDRITASPGRAAESGSMTQPAVTEEEKDDVQETVQ
jgi:hypothetical protein